MIYIAPIFWRAGRWEGGKGWLNVVRFEMTSESKNWLGLMNIGRQWISNMWSRDAESVRSERKVMPWLYKLARTRWAQTPGVNYGVNSHMLLDLKKTGVVNEFHNWIHINYYYYIRLTAFFPGQPGQAGTRNVNILDFTGARDDGGGKNQIKSNLFAQKTSHLHVSSGKNS